MSAGAAAAAAARASAPSSSSSRASPSRLAGLLVASAGALRAAAAAAGSRVLALDVTQTHVSAALSDCARRRAYPLGVFARTGSASADGLLLTSALRAALTFGAEGRAGGEDGGGGHGRGENDNDGTGAVAAGKVEALVVGAPPQAGATDHVAEYAAAMLGQAPRGADDDAPAVLPGLRAALFYSEAHALHRALAAHADVAGAAARLPLRGERVRVRAFERAMHPIVEAGALQAGYAARGRISASEVLQAVLDEMERGAGGEDDGGGRQVG